SLPAGLKSKVDEDPSTLDVITDASNRALILEYARIANEMRLVHLTGYQVSGIDVTYNYDEGLDLDDPNVLPEGNLTSVIRAGGGASDTRTQEYTYTPGI